MLMSVFALTHIFKFGDPSDIPDQKISERIPKPKSLPELALFKFKWLCHGAKKYLKRSNKANGILSSGHKLD